VSLCEFSFTSTSFRQHSVLTELMELRKDLNSLKLGKRNFPLFSCHDRRQPADHCVAIASQECILSAYLLPLAMAHATIPSLCFLLWPHWVGGGDAMSGAWPAWSVARVVRSYRRAAVPAPMSSLLVGAL
jgi:hypothetical protein